MAERWRPAVQLAIALLVWVGCGHRRTTVKNVVGAEARIGRVEIEGNHALKDREIEDHMNLRQTKWFPRPKREWFLEGLIPVDRKRIEELYAAHGYHDARVEAIEPGFRRRGKVVDLHVSVVEHDPTRVRAIRYQWPEGPPSGPPDRRVEPARIQKLDGLAAGEVFDVAELTTSEAGMRAALRERGYAFAEVTGAAEVDRDARTADVVYRIVPGAFVRLGEIRITGLVSVPEAAVRTEIEGFTGKPFSPSRIDKLEQAVYGLDVFSAVTVVPDETAVDGRIGVTVDVSEAQPQSIRLGLGLGFDPMRWQQYGVMRYSHTNIDRKLARFDLGLRAGYAELPAPWDPRDHGPIAELTPSIRRKGFLERKLVWTAAPSFELGVQAGYQFYAPKTRLGVSRFFTRFVELDLSHNFRFVDFFAVDPALNASDSILGLDFRDPYTLSYIELVPTLHLTDRLLDPQHGVVLLAPWNLAGGIFGGNFDYNRVTPELRAFYTPIRNRLQLAARAQAGFILPFGDEPGAPFDLQYYLGGSNTVRGFAYRQISPKVSSCDADGSDCRQIPIGGQTMVSGSFEVRARVWKGLWLVAFADMGDVRAGVRSFDVSQWNYTAGPGVRYHSKIGVFRLDAGFRINTTEYGRGQPIGGVHFGLGEAF